MRSRVSGAARSPQERARDVARRTARFSSVSPVVRSRNIVCAVSAFGAAGFLAFPNRFMAVFGLRFEPGGEGKREETGPSRRD